jgi:hypothetical protein
MCPVWKVAQLALLGCDVFVNHCDVYEAFAFEDHFSAI